MSLAGRVAARGVGLYRYFLRPMRASAAPTCRYTPSCSEYALEAFETWGLFRGGWLALRRLGRCHPWAGVGDDPVPQRPETARTGTPVETEPLMAQPHQPRSPHVRL